MEENNPNIDLAHKEQFCNQFSASLQIPKEIFEQFKNKHKLQFGNKEQLDNAITKIKKYFHVSREAAARRLLTFGHATRDYYLHVREKQMTALEMERQNSGGGGDGKKYYKWVMQWNGIKYMSLAFNAFHDKKYLMRKSPRR